MSQPRKTELSMTIARRLRIRMATKGMNGADVARATGCGYGQMSNYLNGNFTMRSDILLRLANVLDCSTDFLLGISSNPNRRK